MKQKHFRVNVKWTVETQNAMFRGKGVSHMTTKAFKCEVWWSERRCSAATERTIQKTQGSSPGSLEEVGLTQVKVLQVSNF